MQRWHLNATGGDLSVFKCLVRASPPRLDAAGRTWGSRCSICLNNATDALADDLDIRLGWERAMDQADHFETMALACRWRLQSKSADPSYHQGKGFLVLGLFLIRRADTCRRTVKLHNHEDWRRPDRLKTAARLGTGLITDVTQLRRMHREPKEFAARTARSAHLLLVDDDPTLIPVVMARAQ